MAAATRLELPRASAKHVNTNSDIRWPCWRHRAICKANVRDKRESSVSTSGMERKPIFFHINYQAVMISSRRVLNSTALLSSRMFLMGKHTSNQGHSAMCTRKVVRESKYNTGFQRCTNNVPAAKPWFQNKKECLRWTPASKMSFSRRKHYSQPSKTFRNGEEHDFS